jgi:hypothetical protein
MEEQFVEVYERVNKNKKEERKIKPISGYLTHFRIGRKSRTQDLAPSLKEADAKGGCKVNK